VFGDCKSPSLEIMLDAVLETQNVNTSGQESSLLPRISEKWSYGSEIDSLKSPDFGQY